MTITVVTIRGNKIFKNSKILHELFIILFIYQMFIEVLNE